MLDHDAITTVIPGATRLAQAESNATVSEMESLPEEIEEQPVAKKRRVTAPKDIKVLVDKALLKAPCDRERLKNHTNDALKACCGDLGLKKSGKKEDLVERIAEHVDAQSA